MPVLSPFLPLFFTNSRSLPLGRRLRLARVGRGRTGSIPLRSPPRCCCSLAIVRPGSAPQPARPFLVQRAVLRPAAPAEQSATCTAARGVRRLGLLVARPCTRVRFARLSPGLAQADAVDGIVSGTRGPGGADVRRQHWTTRSTWSGTPACRKLRGRCRCRVSAAIARDCGSAE